MKFGLPFAKENKKEYFLTLVLRNEKVNAVFFEESAGIVSVLAKHTEPFANSIEEATIEELLETVDKAISNAEQSLSSTSEKVKTIFGVKGSWVEENTIKKDYLSKLKKISDEMGLVPIGFLVIFEAIAFLMEKDEGAPVTMILAEVGEKFVSAALIKAGKIKEFKTSEISGSPASTLDNVMKHFTSSEIFPQRIVILAGDEDETQEFIDFKWSKSLPFLHVPQVTTLTSEFDAKAVLYGAASQLGFEMPQGDLPKDDEEFIEAVGEKGPEEIEEEANGDAKIISPDTSLEYFGFIEGKDIATEVPPIAKQPSEALSEEDEKIVEEQIEEIPEEVKEERAGRKQLPINASAILSGGRMVISKMIKTIKLPSKPLSFISVLPGGGKIIFVPAILLILFIGVLYFYFFSNTATVVLNIDAKPVDTNQDITFATDSQNDPSGGVLASQFLSITQEGTISTKATGKKEEGTNAKGTVTIFNSSTSNDTQLAAGATITSSNGLEFTLDKSISVASASGDIFSGTTPGKGNASVTAKKIGQEYNLPSNTKFSVSGSNSIAAKNDEAFSGGTKKDIIVASSKDIDKLEEELPKSLEPQAKEELAKKIAEDEVLLPILIDRELVKKTYNKKENEETSEIKLTGTVQFQGISYKKSDGLDFAKEVLKNEISQDEMIDPDSLTFELEDIDQDENNVNARALVKGFVIPKVEADSLAKEISGKSFNNAEQILKKTSQISDADIKLSFNLPFLPKRLPFSSKNIKIITKVHE